MPHADVCTGSRKVNGVAELHSELVRKTIMKDMVDIFGVSKFGNVTNGITPRRWLDQCNPGLSDLITEKLGIPKSKWLKDLTLLKGLEKWVGDEQFKKDWNAVKRGNKKRLALYVEETMGVVINPEHMFDVQVS